MKKLIVLLVVSMLLVLTACTPTSPATTSTEASTETTTAASAATSAATTAESTAPQDGVPVMRIGTPTTNDPQVYEMTEFKRIIEEKIPGKLTVELYPSGQLGSNSQMLQGLQAGTIQALLEPTAFLGGFSSVCNVVDLPYFFKDVWSASELLNGPGGDPLRAFLEEKGITTGSFYPYGDRITLTTTKVDSMDGWKGKKIRVMGAKVLQDQFNSWGASGIPMDVPELYTALQQKTLDGLESAAQFFQTGKYYEVSKYLLMEPKGAEVTIFMINKAWLDSLPADVKQAVLDAAAEVQPLAEANSKKTQDEAIEIMKGTGVEVVNPSDEFHNALVEASEVVHTNFLKDNPDAQSIYDELKKAIG